MREMMKSLCFFPSDYDKVYNFLVEHNKEGARVHQMTPESFAEMTIHDCITSVLFGDAGRFCMTGMCLAVRYSSNPDEAGYRQVILAIKL